MKKKATVLATLISLYLIGMSGIGAVSASDDPSGDIVITVYKINPDDPKATPIATKTFEGSTAVMMTLDEDGTVNIEAEGDNIITETLKPAERIDASTRTLYYKATAKNTVMGQSCSITSSSRYIGVVGVAGNGYLHCRRV